MHFQSWGKKTIVSRHKDDKCQLGQRSVVAFLSIFLCLTKLTQQEGILGHGHQEAEHPLQMQRLPSGLNPGQPDNSGMSSLGMFLIVKKLVAGFPQESFHNHLPGRRFRIHNGDAKTNQQA